jgi:hypothetical protein
MGMVPQSEKSSAVGPGAVVSMVETDAVNVGQGLLALRPWRGPA